MDNKGIGRERTSLISNAIIADTGREIGSLIDILKYRVKQTPDSQLYRFLEPNLKDQSTLTYQELDQSARYIGHVLQEEYGIQPGDRVVLLFCPGLSFLEAFFACLYIEAIAVPVYPPGSGTTWESYWSIVENCDAAIILADNIKAKFLQRHFNFYKISSDIPIVNLEELISNFPIEQYSLPENITVNPKSIAMLQYTSGTTSLPKGVMLTHENILHNESLINEQVTQGYKVCVSWLPLYHDMGLFGAALQAIFVGGECILMAPSSFANKPYRWLKTISDYQAAVSGCPNFAYDLCVETITKEELSTLNLSHWKVAASGGEPIQADTLRRFADKFAPCGFSASSYVPCYGLAESTLLVTAKKADVTKPPLTVSVAKEKLKDRIVALNDNPEERRELVSCGQISEDEVVVVAPNNKALKNNLVGEIWIKNPSLSQGYWNNSSATQDVFNASVNGGEKGFYKTGDLGFIYKNQLFISGRTKDLIIIHGKNHYPNDIERTVQKLSPVLLQDRGAVFSLSINGIERVIVTQELKSELLQEMETNDLLEAIRATVTKAHQVHVYGIALLKAGQILKTSSGKVKRKTAMENYLAGKLDVLVDWKTLVLSRFLSTDQAVNKLEAKTASGQKQESILTQTHHTNASSPKVSGDSFELQLVQIWADLLEIAPQNIGVHDNLFGLGGNSLLATRVVSRIKQQQGFEPPLKVLFDNPTISGLARWLKTATNRVETLPLLASTRDEYVPLSFAQERLWFLSQMEGGSEAYHSPAQIQLSGQLNVRVLEQAFKAIVQRHENLRTQFVEVEGIPQQRISKNGIWQFNHVDVTHMEKVNQELALEKIRQQVFLEPFNLASSALFRTTLISLGTSDFILLVNMHHIITDGWSTRVLVDELVALYSAFIDNKSSPLTSLTIQYADYVKWQRQLIETDELNKQLDYWVTQLADAPILSLPTDKRRPPLQTYNGNKISVHLPKLMTEELRLLGQGEDCSLYMILLSAFNILLFRYTGQEDICVGSPIANRTHTELEPLIGLLVNTLTMRSNLSGNPSFIDLLKRIKETTLQAYENQDIPFEQVVDKVQLDREISHSPLFQVMLVLQNMPKLNFALPHVSLNLEEPNYNKAKFEITLVFSETSEGLEGYLEYNTDLFTQQTMIRMVSHFEVLLQDILSNPNRPISQLELLTTEDKQLLLNHGSCSSNSTNHNGCIHELFEAQVEKTPDSSAVVFGDIEISYAQLNVKANQLAHYLIQQGVAPGSIVAVHTHRSVEMVIGILGILKAGGAYLPLDPNYPSSRSAYMMSDSSASVLLTESHLLQSDLITELDFSTDRKIICLDKEWQAFAEQPTHNPPTHNPLVACSAKDLAYIIYTSGSTGQPKGVMIEHRNTYALIQWALTLYSLEELQGVLFSTSLCFDLSAFELYVTLSSGGCVILVENILSIADYRGSTPITLINTVPSAVDTLIRESLIPTSVLTVNLAGELLTQDLVDQVYSTTSIEKVYDLYGPTEDTTYSTYTLREKNGTANIGRPIQNGFALVLDKHEQLLPAGVPGQLFLGGSGLARGYLNQPKLTEEKFIANPFISDGNKARLYKTGDWVRCLPDGNLEYLGRMDDQVKIRGFRIELGEIEAELLRQDMVYKCVVVAKSVEGKAYSADKVLVAYVELTANDKDINFNKVLQEKLATKLPSYMIPSAWVHLPSMPLTANGKIDKKALPSPEINLRNHDKLIAPTNALEFQLRTIWSEILGLDSNTVGVNQDFFELGGNSLLATQVVTRIRGDLFVGIFVKDIFLHPTIEKLAALLARPMAEDDIYVSLEQELDCSLSLGSIKIKPKLSTAVDNILITGSTGFVGKYLLREILTQSDANIYCLVRGNNTTDAQNRILSNLVDLGLSKSEVERRIFPVIGDLAKPQLGLSNENYQRLSEVVDVVYHNGAHMNHLANYQELKPINVLGTREIISFAANQKLKKINYVSTINVFSESSSAEKRFIDERTTTQSEQHLVSSGYSASKWIAEEHIKLAQAQGVPTTIFRLGIISGDSVHGHYDRSQWFYKLLESCSAIGYRFYGYPDFEVAILPVDFTAQALVKLSHSNDSNGQIYHLLNPHKHSVERLLEWSQFSASKKLRPIDIKDWLLTISRRVEQGEDISIVPLLQEVHTMSGEELEKKLDEISHSNNHFVATHTLDRLSQLGADLPVIDSNLLGKYFNRIDAAGNAAETQINLTEKVDL